jgi:hypothetical protein
MVFVVLSQMTADLRLSQAIQSKFPNKSLSLGPGQWLLAGPGTAKDISDQLGISDGSFGVTAEVFAISGYFGWAPNNIWEWITANWK